MTKEFKHIDHENAFKELNKLKKHFDDLCPGCRLRLLTILVGHYINRAPKEHQGNYAAAFFTGLSCALDNVSILQVEQMDGEETRH